MALSDNKTTALYTSTAVYAHIEVSAMHAHAGVYYTSHIIHKRAIHTRAPSPLIYV